MSDFDETMRRIKELQASSERRLKELRSKEPDQRRIYVDKRTHRIRFEDETEDSVTIVIEKEDQG